MRAPSKRILILGGGKEPEELKKYLDKRLQLGYQVKEIVSNPSNLDNEHLIELIKNHDINILVVDKLNDQVSFRNALFNNLFFKINVFDLADFYEIVIKKIPISNINESWFLINSKYFNKDGFRTVKRIFDFVLSSVCFIITLPFWPLIALLIKLDSKGPVFYTHERIGENDQAFKIIKFRSMIVNAETQGPHWTEKNDKRITHLGKFLRKTHIDELPQFINILKGDLSFVGPRPEERELVDLYSQEIPYYRIRHLAKPGMIGWAQLNYPHGASVDDAIQKLQYDFYYLKNRSFWLDLSIIIRVVRIVLTQPTH
jgi:exopolysaccharide biosynthesis polyprenyl glycosylphosphotransferase